MGLTMRATASLIQRVEARDRALLERFSLTSTSPAASLRFWRGVTHAGGATATLSAAIAPLLWQGPLGEAALRSLVILVTSHLLVQLVKRSVGRPRPSTVAGWTPVAVNPDRFSFPSGHAAAAMSIAIGYASVLPVLTLPLVALAALVGASRVLLGVHYPGDVAAGQLLALLTAVAASGLA
jgi:undecaprenyl-diphosphatase